MLSAAPHLFGVYTAAQAVLCIDALDCLAACWTKYHLLWVINWDVLCRVLKGLDVKLKHAKMDREQKKNFYIESVSGLPNANFIEPPDAEPSAKKGF